MSDIAKIIGKQRNYFKTGITKQVSFREKQLKKLKEYITTNENEILEALKKDLNKAPFESYETEVGIVIDELKYTIKHLKKWSKPKRVKTPVMHFISSSRIYPEPYGISLIMSPWNYPFQLTIAPLIGSIAAGNCSVVKPSAYSSNTSAIIAKMLKECFNEEFVSVVEGGREANQELFDQEFDYIFFTGSVKVGKIVMESAAKNLTPITLELGGKSPCIVDKETDICIAARRIVWGKFLNAGQTCVAPDYLLVHKDVKTELILYMKKYIKKFYGINPCNNADYPKIINEKHYNRLMGLLNNQKIIIGGNGNKQNLHIAPTIIDNVSWDAPVMQEEIFGPIMPVLIYEDLSEIISNINNRPKPLALYFFSTNKKNIDKIISSVSFGGGCINDTIVHLATHFMPFGGVGSSGMGGYHGKASFDTFTHYRSVLKKSNKVDIKFRYPPYNNKLEKLKKIL